MIMRIVRVYVTSARTGSSPRAWKSFPAPPRERIPASAAGGPIFPYARRVAEVLLYTLSFILSRALPAAILRADLQQLRGEMLTRAWPDSSLWSAVGGFGLLCVPIHFVRTRRSLLGGLLGAFWLLCVALIIGLSVEGWAWIFGVEE